jgi:TPP-dependent pyruvate/acetoin dehydrogenase alpha subunit
MIRNQGSLLVRGFSPRDIMRQYMAKADSPTFG